MKAKAILESNRKYTESAVAPNVVNSGAIEAFKNGLDKYLDSNPRLALFAAE